MSNSSWEIKVPGKLMIAGEYAILEPKQTAVVIAIDRYVTAKVERSNERILSLPQLGLHRITWRRERGQLFLSPTTTSLSFVGQALEVTSLFLEERSIQMENFKITITSELADNEGRKYGLGSSAAIVVALVASILSVNKVKLSKEHIFKLSAIAHIKAQGNGSCTDIAASTFGGWIHYSAFQPEWVLAELRTGTMVSELIRKRWPNLSISLLTPPPHIELCVGWTKEIARTGPMVEKIQTLRKTKRDLYEQFLKESSYAVSCFVNGFETGNVGFVMEGISLNRQALRKLGEFANVAIETPKLKTLCDLAEKFGKGKSSGAGGGDCGIAFIDDYTQKSKLYEAWEREGIFSLPLNVSQNGLAISEYIQST